MIKRFFFLLFDALTNKGKATGIIKQLAARKKINLLMLAYRDMGIHKASASESGENYVIKKVLPQYINLTKPVMFDVGANVGDYSLELSQHCPEAIIYAFEPVKKTYEILSENVTGTNIQTFNIGLGSHTEEKPIYFTDNASSHATLFSNALTDLHNEINFNEEVTQIYTIDDFCKTHHINEIDFLKIDTEGNEYAVLQGAQNMLKHGRIGIIQFEFNEMNIISRVFLKDFYEILKDYLFFRINTAELISLGNYCSFNEIFQFQNILAIHKFKTLKN